MTKHYLVPVTIAMLLSACFTVPRPTSGGHTTNQVVGSRYACNTEPRDEATEARLMGVIETYAPTQAKILRYLHSWEDRFCESRSRLAEFIKKDKKPGSEEELKELETSVHENVHRFSTANSLGEKGTHLPGRSRKNGPYFDVSNGKHYMAVYLPGQGIVHIPMMRTYGSSIMLPFVRDKVLHAPRFEAYVRKSNSAEGVFDLLDEYHAYYHGFAYREALVKARKYSIVIQTKVVNKTKGNSFNSTTTHTKYKPLSDLYLSHPQFTYYILTYMKALKKKSPKLFAALSKNRALWRSFVAVHDQFEPVYKGYLQRKIKLQRKYKYALSKKLEKQRKALELILASAEYKSLMNETRKWAKS